MTKALELRQDSLTPRVLVPSWKPHPAFSAYTTLCLNAQDPSADGRVAQAGGVLTEAITAQRRLLGQAIAWPSEPKSLAQVHGHRVLKVDEIIPGDRPQADAVYADRPLEPCAVVTADCLPILVRSLNLRKVAAIHAGWKGLALGVIAQTFEVSKLLGEVCDVWLGPAISAESYTVGGEFLDHFPEDTEAFFKDVQGHWHADLKKIAIKQLKALGCRSIFGGDRCTYRDPQCFSHRRGTTGRMLSLIWMNEETKPVPQSNTARLSG